MSTVLTSKRRSSHSKIKEESNNNLEVPNDSESSISNTLLSTNMKTGKLIIRVNNHFEI